MAPVLWLILSLRYLGAGEGVLRPHSRPGVQASNSGAKVWAFAWRVQEPSGKSNFQYGTWYLILGHWTLWVVKASDLRTL